MMKFLKVFIKNSFTWLSQVTQTGEHVLWSLS